MPSGKRAKQKRRAAATPARTEATLQNVLTPQQQAALDPPDLTETERAINQALAGT